MRIYICGFMGAGKSSLLRRIDPIYHGTTFEKQDLDELIIDEISSDFPERFSAISDFCSQFGWDKFRELETSILKKIINSNTENMIVALGGGTLSIKTNVELIKNDKNSVILWLRIPFEDAYLRAKGGEIVRPLMKKSKDEVKNIFIERERDYSISDIVCDNKDISQILSIEDIIKKRCKKTF